MQKRRCATYKKATTNSRGLLERSHRSLPRHGDSPRGFPVREIAPTRGKHGGYRDCRTPTYKERVPSSFPRREAGL